MRIKFILILILLLVGSGCSDITEPDMKVLVAVEAEAWEADITGPSYEYEVVAGESFAPFGADGEKLFMLSAVISEDWIFVTYDEKSLMRCGGTPSGSSASNLTAIGSESVSFESRNSDASHQGYRLRMVKQ